MKCLFAQKSLQPPLPNDLALSFYIQSHKLVCAVYHMHKDHSGQLKFDIFQVRKTLFLRIFRSLDIDYKM